MCIDLIKTRWIAVPEGLRSNVERTRGDFRFPQIVEPGDQYEGTPFAQTTFTCSGEHWVATMSDGAPEIPGGSLPTWRYVAQFPLDWVPEDVS